ncbi:MAG TPA: LysE family translocator [Roseiflexaceae bacterium]|nr:LysE family translocator [Roseiflexaceae bacterium]
MFDLPSLTLFVVASWVLIITPGPDSLYVLTRSIAQGKQAGIVSALGVTVGIFVHTLAAAFGLAVVLQTSALAFLVVKYAGALYLLYLGVRTLKDRSSLSLAPDHKSRQLRKLFGQGVLSNVTNPKIALFFLAFLPQFVHPENGHAALQMLILGAIFAFFGVTYLSALAYGAGQIGALFARNPRLLKPLRWATGTVFIGLGLRLAFAERR